ncbi:phospholipid:diacylglycerol acyltransferase [Malassezia sp. CBS 17886]|nr:phospholipid:diacylglycerol acyltransferase [Malassezia sp. CBS 17886]
MTDILSVVDDGVDFDMLNLQSFLPKDVAAHLDNLYDTSRKLFETLDFRVGAEARERGARPKHPVVLLPGIVSTGLESWTTSGKEGGYFRKRLWGSTTMVRNVLFDKENWVRHLTLNTTTGLDPSGIRVRAAQGLDAASYFAAGYWIWSKIIENLAAVGYDNTQVFLASYDWRLSMSNLQERDHLYTRLKAHIETNTLMFKEKTVVVTHSMGATVGHYFLKWVEQEAGSEWVDTHIEAIVNIAGPMLGVPKAMGTLMTGEMRESVDVPLLLSRMLERFFSAAERTALFRSWAGAASMLMKGGDHVWGNLTSAPDDPPDAARTFGLLYQYARAPHTHEQPPRSSTEFTTDEAYPWLMEHAPPEFQRMIEMNYSLGFERDAAQVKRNNRDERTWTNPLESALPNAPNLKMYCVYGWGKPTERGYWLRDAPVEYAMELGNATEDNATRSANSTLSQRLTYRSRIDQDVHEPDATPGVNVGCRVGEGDGTASLLSLGAMCVEGWKQPRYNPAGIKVVTHELQHKPDAFDIRGGAETGDHVDILGSYGANDAVVRIATGHGDEVQDHFVSQIRDYAKKIDWRGH